MLWVKLSKKEVHTATLDACRHPAAATEEEVCTSSHMYMSPGWMPLNIASYALDNHG